MSIIATAKVPSNGSLAIVPTIELPKIRTSTASHRKPEPAIATPCPLWCVEHTSGTPGCPGDRSTVHEAPRATVETALNTGPNDTITERHEVQVWAERFDLDAEQDGHPVLGNPVVHLMVDQTDSTGMTAGQAEQIGRALLDSATKVRAYAAGTAQSGGSPVWPPKTCPSWCSYAGDHGPTEGMHPVDRHHSYNFPSEDAESVYLSLHPSDLADPPAVNLDRELRPQRLVVDMQQPYREVEPTIHLIHMDRGWKRSGSRPDFTPKANRRVELTPAEARRLADRLVLLADLAAGADPIGRG